MTTATYLLALGSNRYGPHGPPAATIAAALAAIGGVSAVSPIIRSDAIGPSIRAYANAAALIETAEPPPALLARLKAIERAFGRRPGRRWGTRVIDLDIIGWSGGAFASPGLAIPHPAYRDRRFVLAPLLAIVPDWRDPVTGRTVRHHLAAIDRRRPRS